jgi:hypothetical protein
MRLIQFLHRNSLISSQLPTRRDSRTRLWQFQGYQVEIAGFPAGLDTTTPYSMGTAENVIFFLGAAVWVMVLLAPITNALDSFRRANAATELSRQTTA